MANSPFNILKTHTWSEVKNYTWGNLTIGQNSKSVTGNISNINQSKRDSAKNILSSISVTGFFSNIYIVGKEAFEKIISSFLNITSNSNRQITLSKTSISVKTSALSVLKSISKITHSFINNLNTTIKVLRRFVNSNTISYSAKSLYSVRSFVTNIILNSSRQLTNIKTMSVFINIVNEFLSRFGKAVVQTINTIAVNSFMHKITVAREMSININVVHKIKQEVIWRMGANSRGEALHMVLGETKVIELTVVNEDGTPTDLAGAYAKFAISGTIEKECGIVGNKITVMIEPDDIENTGTYDYEFRLKDIFNRVDSLIMGKVIVEPKVVSAY